MTNSDYIQYGCGLCAPLTWRNFDVSPTLRLQRIPLFGRLFRGGRIPIWPDNVEYGDIVSGLPIKADSCQAVYCSHVLEHLALENLRIALGNTYSYLAPGGIFRFVLPDLEFYVHAYVDSNAPDAALNFMEGTLLGTKTRKRGIIGIARSFWGNSSHLWMWDFKSMTHELEQVGFESIRRAQFGDSQDQNFEAVEDPGRWENCLGIECRKP